ncbi:MAG: Arm DNA-binding domain-containing protein [Synergistaceae bacterium]|nr:Arm DNA-binding domain-containing protein [Synergistaceae bacterium]
MKLNDRQVAALKPEEKRYMRCVDDGLGLYIEVMVSGTKYWRMRYRKGKKEEKLTLGKYPILSLADARDMCIEARRHATHNGGTPRDIVCPPVSATFWELAEKWYTQNAGAWSKSHTTDVRHKLDTYLLPQLGDKPIASITVQDLIGTFRPMILQDILPQWIKPVSLRDRFSNLRSRLEK